MNYRKCENCNSDELVLDTRTNEFVCTNCAVVQTDLNIPAVSYQKLQNDPLGSYFIAKTNYEKKMIRLNDSVQQNTAEKKRLENRELIFDRLNEKFSFNEATKKAILDVETEIRRYINKSTRYQYTIAVAIIYYCAKHKLMTIKTIFNRLKIKKTAPYLRIIEKTAKKIQYKQIDEQTKKMIMIERILNSFELLNKNHKQGRSLLYMIIKSELEKNKFVREAEIAELIYEILIKNNIKTTRREISNILKINAESMRMYNKKFKL